MKNLKKLSIMSVVLLLMFLSACAKKVETNEIENIQIDEASYSSEINVDKAENVSVIEDGDLVKKYVGTYVRRYTDEIEGDVIDIVDSITLKDDMTCVCDFQDTVEGVWDLEGNLNAGGSYDSYSIEDNRLILTRGDDGMIFEFVKE